MTSADIIKRIEADPDGLDFSSLRARGIELAQAVSGKVWTDYNLHDPGVTVLEQLCFGLTELSYQAGIPVADYLANEHGQIHYAHYGLYKPHEIFPTRPVTAEDYCKLFLDALPDIDAVHVDLHTENRDYGRNLYNIAIKILEPLTGQPLTDEQKQELLAKVRKFYLANRNLGEDLNNLSIEKSLPCFLKGSIETNGKRNAAEIYADIFFRCSRKISSNIRIDRYEDVFAQNPDLASIFDGPMTKHGYINSADLRDYNHSKPLDEITGLVAQIDGVKKVYHLELVDEHGIPVNELVLDHKSFYLKFPEHLHQQQWLAIDFNPGKTTDAEGIFKLNPETSRRLLNETQRHLQKLEFAYRAFRNNKINAANFYQLPKGKTKHELDYYSIQHHFPNVYGINAAGVPYGESPERKLHAKQLKTYLYPFEQLMANMLAQIQQLHRLFSLQERSHYSYFAQFLDNYHIPDINDLYIDKNLGLADIQSVQARHDPAIDRKNRALDTLLALYGEEFGQEALLHFNAYHQENPGYWAIDNKVRYLLHLVELSSRRGGAFNSAYDIWEKANLSSLHKKLNILLGIKHFHSNTRLSQWLPDKRVHLVDDATLVRHTQSIAVDAVSQQEVPVLTQDARRQLKQWQYQPNKDLRISNSMLRDGVNLDCYKLVTQGRETQVYFHLQQQKCLTPLSNFSSTDQAINYVHKFKKIITDLNVDSEGFYLVEHILLRPRASKQSSKKSDNTFFDCRLSFIFPDWSARFANPAFRQFAEKTIANQLPAHLFPQVYWLDLKALTDFEHSYTSWLEALNRYEQAQLDNTLEDVHTNALDKASALLKHWLQQRPHSQHYWV